MVQIENYTDYREFLKDIYIYKKKKFPFFSYRYFCKKAGITSPGFYNNVILGKRNLTLQTIPKFISGLELSKQEAKYFTALVHFTQAKSSKLKQEYLDQMRGLLPPVSEKILPVDFYAYYSKWYHIVLRELACTIDWQEDYQVLAKSVFPQIKKKEAKESIELLEKLGLVKKRKNGQYVQTNRNLTTKAEVTSLAVKNVNHQFSKLGVEAIHKIPPSNRDISSLTMGMSTETYGLVKTEIQNFYDRIKRLVNNQESSTSVYNMNVQFFPLSQFENQKESESNDLE